MPVADMPTAVDDILTLFKAAWDAQTPPVPALVYENLNADQPGADEEWAEVEIRHYPRGRGQATLAGETGSRRFNANGDVLVRIRVPLGTSRARADDLAEVAARAFEGAATADDGVWFRDVSASEWGRDEREHGVWYRVDVVARFTYDIVR